MNPAAVSPGGLIDIEKVEATIKNRNEDV